MSLGERHNDATNGRESPACRAATVKHTQDHNMVHSVATGGLDSMHTTPTDHTRSAGRVRPPRQLPAAGTDCALACNHAYHVLIALRYLGRPHHTCMHRVPHRPQGLGNAMHGHTCLAHNPDCSLHTRSSSTLATCTVSFQASAPCAGHAHLSSTQSLPSSTLTQSKGSHQCWRAQHITGSSQADLPISTHSCVTGSSCPPGLELG